VDVLQAGRSTVGRDGMALHSNDVVRTFGSSYAQVRFLDGDQVWLDFDTRVRVGSIFTFFGRVFAAVSGVFEVDSEFVAASSEGTEYTVTIGRGGRNNFSVAVRTGAVRCVPRRGRWRAVRLVAGQRLRGQGGATPALDRLDNREMQSEFGWVPALRKIPGKLRPLPPRPEGYTQPVPRRPAPVTKPSEPVVR
jgi:ferric-dicitrate binding protein FerR (iron transport regulator)